MNAMNLVLNEEEATALCSVLTKTIKDLTADERLNGWKIKELPALRRVTVQLLDRMKGKEQP